MTALASTRLTGPSSSLLKFLRSQADSLCFFTSCVPSTPCAGSRTAHISRSLSRYKIPSRSLTTTARCNATLEASLINLDFLPNASNLRFPSLHRTSRPSGVIVHHKSQDRQCQARWSFSDTEEAQWRRWFALRRWSKEKSPPLKQSDLPPLPFLSDATLGRMKATNDLKLRCTEFDENGRVLVVDGEFRKQELIAKYGLLPRDLRKIDSSMLPSIIVRPSVILINLLHLKLLIKHNRVLVFDAYGSTDSHTQSVFMYDLEGKLCQKDVSHAAGGLPYEFRALEAVLVSVTSGLEMEFETVRDPVVQVLRELEEDIDREKLRHLLIYSKKLGTFEQKARLVRDAIDDLLEDDDELSTMYLSEYAQGKERDPEDHEEIELLLESYHRVADEIVQVSASLVNSIRNTEEIVKAILDANRNSLMLLDLKFSIGTLGIGSGAFVAALYGMNLKNFIEESDLGFWGVSGVSAVFAAIVCVYGLQKLRRVQRVSMWGESGRRNRGSWGNVDAAQGGGARDTLGGGVSMGGGMGGVGVGGGGVGGLDSMALDSMRGLPGEGRMERIKRLKEAKQAAWRGIKEGRGDVLENGVVSGLPAPRKEGKRK